MRISAEPTDAGFHPEIAQFITVLIDGVRAKNIITADEELGYILRFKMAETGAVETDDAGVPRTEELTGVQVSLLLNPAGADLLRPRPRSNYSRTASWLLSCGKEIANLGHLSVQVGVHIEECMEFIEQLQLPDDSDDIVTAVAVLNAYAGQLKKGLLYASFKSEEKALDALCDTEVTLNGVAYLAGWDKPEADRKVLDANDAKLVDGRPVLLEGGKIGKPEGWLPADLSDCV